jgi:predicted transcriptional regulator
MRQDTYRNRFTLLCDEPLSQQNIYNLRRRIAAAMQLGRVGHRGKDMSTVSAKGQLQAQHAVGSEKSPLYE